MRVGLAQINTTVGDLNLIAVEGVALVTLTGYAYATARLEGTVLCLDAGTGEIRWSRVLDGIGGVRDHAGLFPHGCPVIAEGKVYLLARKVSAQSLTGCTVVAFDLGTGSLEWIRLIASSGSKT